MIFLMLGKIKTLRLSASAVKFIKTIPQRNTENYKATRRYGSKPFVKLSCNLLLESSQETVS